MNNLIEVCQLSKEFPLKGGVLDFFKKETPKVHAVDGLNFAIKKGEVLGLVGESGSGKSTTGRLLLRLLDPTGGEVLYHGTDLCSLDHKAMDALREKVQVVFQDPVSSLNPRMTVGQAIEHPLIIHAKAAPERKNAAFRRKAVLDMMEDVGLSPAEFLYNKYPHQLSGGQSQRVVIARALITRPDFVVADEPIAMADASVRALILKLLERLKKEFDLTYLFITHDLGTAKYLCDRIAVMYLGRIVEIGTREEIFHRPHHPYTKALLAAVPVPDPRHRGKKDLPQGEIPSAVNPPPGCHFHPRCAFARPECSQARPAEKKLSETHRSACVLE